jgi:glyoxylase-like metal-dependent hydrolase (beta-lactamase superfamily II)
MILAPTITRLVAGNAGPFTGEGTNTYLVGTQTLAVIDPGPDDAAHVAAILQAAGQRPISHILLTHRHRDHADAIPRLKAATGARTVAFPRPPAGSAEREATRSSLTGGDFVAWEFEPDEVVSDGHIVRAGDVELEALHTPGHAPDHLCFAMGGAHPVLFSGDHVMGWSTSVIAPPEGHMGHYLASLERVLARPEVRYLPGHGADVDDGPRTAKAYLLHRRMREAAVLDAISRGAQTIHAVTELVYAGIAPHLVNAARLSVQAHVELLAERGVLVAGDDGLRAAP